MKILFVNIDKVFRSIISCSLPETQRCRCTNSLEWSKKGIDLVVMEVTPCNGSKHNEQSATSRWTCRHGSVTDEGNTVLWVLRFHLLRAVLLYSQPCPPLMTRALWPWALMETGWNLPILQKTSMTLNPPASLKVRPKTPQAQLLHSVVKKKKYFSEECLPSRRRDHRLTTQRRRRHNNRRVKHCGSDQYCGT